MRLSISIVLAVAATVTAASSAACGGAGKKSSRSSLPTLPDAVVRQVNGVVEQWRQGHELRNIDAIASLYAQTPELVMVVQGRIQRGWPAVKESITAFYASHAEVKMIVADLKVEAVGERGAVASAQVTRRYGDGVTTIEEAGAVVMALRHDEDGWRIIAEHYSYAPVAE
jgi:uncharacterized protein (TIGR02246 family)